MYVERNFSARVMAEKYVKIYKHVIAAKNAPARAFSPALQKPLAPSESVIIKKVLPAQAAQSAKVEPEVEPML